MRAFIGVGPGRCGTTSLARILNGCKNTMVTHEAYPSPWYKAERNIGALVLAMRGSGGVLTGDVSCTHLPHLGALRDPIRDLKIVCLHRHKDEVVRSFMKRKHLPPLRPSDREIRMNNLARMGYDPESTLLWPVIDAASSEQAWGFYWEMAEEIMAGIADPVLHLQMRQLNDDFSLEKLFDFLEIPESDRVFPKQRVWNATEQL